MVNLKASARRMRRTERQFEVFFSLSARSFSFFFHFWGECQPHWRCSVDVDDVFSLADGRRVRINTPKERKKWILNFTENFCGDLKKFLIKFFREKVFFFSTLRCRPNQAWTRGKFRKKIASPTQQSRHRQRQTLCRFLGGPVSSSEQERKRRHDTTTQFA